MRKRTIRYTIDERSIKRLIVKISKWQVADDIKIIISKRSEIPKKENEERESVASPVKVGRIFLLFKDHMKLILSVI